MTIIMRCATCKEELARHNGESYIPFVAAIAQHRREANHAVVIVFETKGEDKSDGKD